MSLSPRPERLRDEVRLSFKSGEDRSIRPAMAWADSSAGMMPSGARGGERHESGLIGDGGIFGGR